MRIDVDAAATCPIALREALQRDPDALVDSGVTVKAQPGDRTTIVRIDRDGGSFMLKRFNRKGLLHTITHLLLRSRAAWNQRNAAMLEHAGLHTPAVHAILEERIGPLRLRSWLLTDWLDAIPLSDWVAKRDSGSPELERTAEEFAAVWRVLGANNIAHGDMKATNFLVDRESRIWLIDLDSMRQLRSAFLLRRDRRRDRARFLRNWQDRPEVEHLFRARIDTAQKRGS